MKYYANIGASEYTIDETNSPVCPDGYIEMKGPRPDGDYVASENGTWIDRESALYKDFQSAKSTIIAKIDNYTSEKIFAGFDYTYNGETLHFSYDSFDQQNFIDTATACQLSMAGGTGLPTNVVWNAYTSDGTLKQLTLDANSFLALYINGALAHKSAIMAEGGAKKAKVRDAATAEELKALVAEWGLQV